MIQWPALPLWTIERHDNLWVTKVDHTFVNTVVAQVHRDNNVRIEVHGSDTGRLIGYTLREKQRGKGPLVFHGPSYLGLFYSQSRDLKSAKDLTDVIYHDSNVRLLAFGRGTRVRDYLFVLRIRGKLDASKKD